jgi:hypothetical protein
MARKNNFGISFSWKRAIGISTVRQNIARKSGIPTTKSGLERKIGSNVLKLILNLFNIKR